MTRAIALLVVSLTASADPNESQHLRAEMHQRAAQAASEPFAGNGVIGWQVIDGRMCWEIRESVSVRMLCEVSR